MYVCIEDSRMGKSVEVKGIEISIMTLDDKDYISLTDMLKAKDGDFFISDWLRNRQQTLYSQVIVRADASAR